MALILALISFTFLIVHPCLSGIPFRCNHLRNSTHSMWCPAFLQNLQMPCGNAPFSGALPLDFEEELYHSHAQIHDNSNKHM
jgi:hypothetical protein